LFHQLDEGSVEASNERFAQREAQRRVEAAMRVAEVEALKLKLAVGDGPCKAPTDHRPGGSSMGPGGNSGGSVNGSAAKPAPAGAEPSAATAAESGRAGGIGNRFDRGDFANDTLTGRSREIVASLGQLFALQRQAPQAVAALLKTKGPPSGDAAAVGKNLKGQKGLLRPPIGPTPPKLRAARSTIQHDDPALSDPFAVEVY
jgi:hypothetical protein